MTNIELLQVLEYGDDIKIEFDGEFLKLTFNEVNEIRWNGFNGKLQILIIQLVTLWSDKWSVLVFRDPNRLGLSSCLFKAHWYKS